MCMNLQSQKQNLIERITNNGDIKMIIDVSR